MATNEIYKKQNLIEIINRDLERTVKEVALDAIVKNQLAEFEAKIRPVVKEQIEQLTFKGIDQMQDMLGIRNDLRLYLQWSDENETKVIENEYSVVKNGKTVVET